MVHHSLIQLPVASSTNYFRSRLRVLLGNEHKDLVLNRAVRATFLNQRHTTKQRHSPYAIKRCGTGLGLFAVRSIPKGKKLLEYTGRIVPNEEVERRRGKYFFEINPKQSIDGSDRNNVARYINHSCAPNAEAIISGRRIWIWSRKDIRPGEEITYDYGAEYFKGLIEPIGCKCKKCNSDRRSSRVV